MTPYLPISPAEPDRWNPFELLVETAQAWVPPGCEFIPISEITFVAERTHGGLWYPPTAERPSARITLGWKEGLPLAWHEVFHSVFSKSRMQQYDPTWAEGWCNAFAEVHHRHFHVPSSHRLEFGTHGKDEYVTPCYLLCAYANFSAEKLKEFWLYLNQPFPAEGICTKTLGYEPATGRIF